jgi:hypothetical protein
VKFRKELVPNSLNNTNEHVWFVELSVPRKLINGMNDASTDYYDDEIDIDDIEGAIDMGVDSESGYIQGEGNDIK